ncbi:Aste57867_15558 [Aphanomyces stellatus]|uniref:Aste57867_15558 protein n=1 Tax=Aphanomyces stellatus TaxID=120398 RepID=A0A485L3E8_9STRA|nr:hypothetical protein As57867_015502 [Aphanomyces stellatus]VFT92360.1 Aste57867_15558 [Aphanomyces stellatus]
MARIKDLEEEVARLREYKTLTKLRMKQAAEKLSSYRVQVEEYQETIATLQRTIAEQNAATEEHLRRIRALEDKCAALEVTASQPEHVFAPQPLTAATLTALDEVQLSLGSSSSSDDDDDDSSSCSSSDKSTGGGNLAQDGPNHVDNNVCIKGDDSNANNAVIVHDDKTREDANEDDDDASQDSMSWMDSDLDDMSEKKTPSGPLIPKASFPKVMTSTHSSIEYGEASPRQPMATSPRPLSPRRTPPKSTPSRKRPLPDETSLDAASPFFKKPSSPDARGPTQIDTPAQPHVVPELHMLQLTIHQKSMAKNPHRATLIVQAFLQAMRTIDDPVVRVRVSCLSFDPHETQNTCMERALNGLVKHHHLSVETITAAMLKTGVAVVPETPIYVDFFWQLTHPNAAHLASVLHLIAHHLTRKFIRNPKVQSTWCRIHTLLARRANLVACSRAFVVDRLVESNRSIWDAIAIGQSWPLVLSPIGSPSAALLPTTIRFLLGELYDAAAAQTEQLMYVQELTLLCRLQPSISSDAFTAIFRDAVDTPTDLFEACASLRLLLRVKGWQWCHTHVPILVDAAAPPSAMRLRLMGVSAATYFSFGFSDALLINHANEMVATLQQVLTSSDAEPSHQLAAATALLEVAQAVPTPAVRQQHVATIVHWFQRQPMTDQLALPAAFLRHLQQASSLVGST